MSIITQVTNGGWGALVLYLYSYLVVYFGNLASQRGAIVISAIPPLLLMFLVYRFNHRLNDFWAGGNLKESTVKIQHITGDSDSYHSASEEIQSTIDEFDKKAYGHHVGILSGIALALATPLLGYLVFDEKGLIGGIVAGVVVIWGLCVRSYNELNRLASDLSIPYEEKYENQ
jgi:hypothetical protein